MFEKQLEILANCGKNVFEAMADIRVEDVICKREQRFSDRFALALLTAYNDSHKGIKGQFVMGFQDETNALLLANAIAEKKGYPPFEDINASAVDILNEYMLAVVEKTTVLWKKTGFSIHTQAPHSILGPGLSYRKKLHTEAFVVILKLSLGWLVFNVTFEKIKTDLKNKQILVVDDSMVIRGLLNKVLGGLGCAIKQLKEPYLAEEALEESCYDLLIMDLLCSAEKTDSILEKLHHNCPYADIILLSSADSTLIAPIEKRFPKVKRLKKPVRIDRFLALVKDILLPEDEG